MKGNYFKLPRLPNSAVCFAFAQFQKTNLDEARVSLGLGFRILLCRLTLAITHGRLKHKESVTAL